MAWYETGYKIVAGWGARQLIVGIPASIGAAVGAAGETEEERERGALKGRVIAGGIASVGSLAMGVWVKNQPGWKATGITQIVFSSISLAAAIALGVVGFRLPAMISSKPALPEVASLIAPPMAGITTTGKGITKLRLKEKEKAKEPEVTVGAGL